MNNSFDTLLPETAAGGATDTFVFGDARTLGTEPISLNLSYQGLGGDAADGFAVAKTGTNGTVFGILPTTNLGGQLLETKGSVKWNAYTQFYITSEAGAVVLHPVQKFVLDVDFATRGISGTLADSSDNPYALTLSATWTANSGVFHKKDGAVAISGGITSKGDFSGLIGNDGLVGVFSTTRTSTFGLTGGVVARAGTKNADWGVNADSADAPTDTVPPLTVAKGGFLISAQNGIELGEFKNAAGGTPIRTSIDLGDGINGVSFASVRTDAGIGFYAGLYRGTDLGGPVPQTTGGSYWNGRFRFIARHVDTPNGNRSLVAPETEISLYVDYGRQTIEAGGGLQFRLDNRTITFTLTDVTFVRSGFVNGRIDLVDEGSESSGPLSGLIGEYGLAAAFYSDTIAGRQWRFAGGLVASPIIQTVDSETWGASRGRLPVSITQTANNLLLLPTFVTGEGDSSG